MAQYTINHVCGHAETVSLFGPGAERERKIEWLSSRECPQCWGATKREEDAKKPITAIIQTNGLDTDGQGNLLISIALTGGTMPRKDEIKVMGYRWQEVRGGIMNLLSMRRPAMAWVKTMTLADFQNGRAKEIDEEIKKLDGIIENGITLMDYAMAEKTIKKGAVNDELKKAIEKPSLPEHYPSRRGNWNGKIYGTEKYGFRIYLDGSEEKITSAEAEEIKAYQAAREKYNMAIEKIERGEA